MTKAATSAGGRCDLCSTRQRCIVSSLPAERIAALQGQIVERAVPLGGQIEEQGLRSLSVKVVKLGLFQGLRRAARGEKRPVCLLGKGHVAGLNNLYRQPAALTLVAITPARVCEIPVRLVDEIAMGDRAFRRCLFQALARYVDNLADWSRVPRGGNVTAQLGEALRLIAHEEGRAAFRIPSHTELARMLGTRRETIARHIGLLIEGGQFVKIDRWHGRLLGMGGPEGADTQAGTQAGTA